MDNKYILKEIINNFQYSINEIKNFDLGYRIARYITNKIELISYSTRTKDFIFFVDENGVENFISVYKGEDELDGEKGVIVEMFIGSSKQKEIFFFTKNKMYFITETRWKKVVDSGIVEDKYSIQKILEILNNDLIFLRNKVNSYKNELNYNGYLKKDISSNIITKFKINLIARSFGL